MPRFWTRAEVNELHEMVETLQRYIGTLSRLATPLDRHRMIAAITLTAGHKIRDAKLDLEAALRVSEEDDNE